VNYNFLEFAINSMKNGLELQLQRLLNHLSNIVHIISSDCSLNRDTCIHTTPRKRASNGMNHHNHFKSTCIPYRIYAF
jgi:hypothetical protein